MRIIAIYAVYNEERFMQRSLQHMIEQGVESYVIDNESTDRTLEIARSFLGKGVVGIETFPRHGVFELAKQLRRKEELHLELGADWYLQQDADQFRYAPNPYKTLAEGIAAVDQAGYNAIDFDVFEFVPTSRDEDYDNNNFLEDMKYYYYFNPCPNFQVKAWKNFGQKVELESSGGHLVEFEGRKIFPQPFIQRHYLALSLRHAVEKYCQREFSPEELARGWHGTRGTIQQDEFYFPDRGLLKEVTENNTWDTSDAKKVRLLLGSA
ncbi:MAG TPA: glycosyltransferase family 2 protein [Pyrinomonadaceae bacterium]|nr:glycosyltransferase family 2 protein [Pyrinomonadaceae bacterium]